MLIPLQGRQLDNRGLNARSEELMFGKCKQVCLVSIVHRGMHPPADDEDCCRLRWIRRSRLYEN